MRKKTLVITDIGGDCAYFNDKDALIGKKVRQKNEEIEAWDDGWVFGWFKLLENTSVLGDRDDPKSVKLKGDDICFYQVKFK